MKELYLAIRTIGIFLMCVGIGSTLILLILYTVTSTMKLSVIATCLTLLAGVFLYVLAILIGEIYESISLWRS